MMTGLSGQALRRSLTPCNLFGLTPVPKYLNLEFNLDYSFPVSGIDRGFNPAKYLLRTDHGADRRRQSWTGRL